MPSFLIPHPTPSPGLLVEQFFLFGQIGKRKFIRIVESKISRIPILSIEKRDCENYLFEDCYLKACMEGQSSGVTNTGRKS